MKFITLFVVVVMVASASLLLKETESLSNIVFLNQHKVCMVAVDQQQHHLDYEFKNEGTGPVKITSIVAKCGCTVADLTKTEYQPGELGSIAVTFDVGSLQGTVKKGVLVTYQYQGQDPVTTELTFEAEIPMLFVAKRKNVVWYADELYAKKTIEIEKRGDIKFIGARYDKELFHVQINDQKDRSLIDIESIGRSFDDLSFLYLETDSPHKRYQSCRITHIFDKRTHAEAGDDLISLYPSTLAWRSGEMDERHIVFKSRHNAVSITSVSILNDNIECSYALSDERDRYIINIKPRVIPKGITVALLRIETDSSLPEQQVINYNLVFMP